MHRPGSPLRCLGAGQGRLGSLACVPSTLRRRFPTGQRGGVQLPPGRGLARSWLPQDVLLAVEQGLTLITGGLSLVDLVLPRVVSSLAAIQLCLLLCQIDRTVEVRRIRRLAPVVELYGGSIARRLVQVGQGLLAVRNALGEIGQHLLLIELFLVATPNVYLVGHVATPWSIGPGLAMW